MAQKLGVSFTPDVVVKDVKCDMSYLILASDGIWDGINGNLDLVLQHLRDAKSLDNACELILQSALKGLEQQQLCDNVTCIIVRFGHE